MQYTENDVDDDDDDDGDDDDDVACVEGWGLHIRAAHPSLDKVLFFKFIFLINNNDDGGKND